MGFSGSKRAPCITIATDFGTADGYVGAMKGVLTARAPGVPICDITHEIPRHDTRAGAFALAQAAPLFPEAAVHVAVVDPGVGGSRRGVVICADGHVFVGPDNGLFGLAAPRPETAYAIEAEAFTRGVVSSTFHGRDVFAPAAAAIAAGAPPASAGPEIQPEGAPGAGGDRVIHVDAFGNLITAIPRARAEGRERVEIEGRTIPLLTTYSDVEHGELLAYIGSADTLEIAAREASAAAILGAGRGTPVSLAPCGGSPQP